MQLCNSYNDVRDDCFEKFKRNVTIHLPENGNNDGQQHDVSEHQLCYKESGCERSDCVVVWHRFVCRSAPVLALLRYGGVVTFFFQTFIVVNIIIVFAILMSTTGWSKKLGPFFVRINFTQTVFENYFTVRITRKL